MYTMQLQPCTDARNAGIAREHAFASACGIEKRHHDRARYDRESDVVAGGIGYSVKAARFTLMSGSACDGRDTLAGIWDLYAARVHSERFVYVSDDWTAYIMTLAEFRTLVFQFCTLERESTQNGGGYKVRFPRETKKVRAWLTSQAR